MPALSTPNTMFFLAGLMGFYSISQALSNQYFFQYLALFVQMLKKKAVGL